MNAYWLRFLKVGFKSMLLHPLRSGLTVLGIFIGVASVIWLVAIGEGISQKAQEQIASLGADNIIVRSIKPPMESVSSQGGPGPLPYGVTRDDLRRLGATLPTARRVVPVRELRRQFSNRDRSLDGRMVGCTPEYQQIAQLEIAEGRFIEPTDIDEKTNYCVLAAETAEKLFPYENPIGRGIQTDDDVFVVIGVLAKRAATSGIGGSLAAEDYSRDVYVSLTTLWERIGDFVITTRTGSMEGEVVELNQVTMKIDSLEHVMPTADVVRNTMKQFHTVEDYTVTVPLELLEQARTMRMMFIVFLGLIAAISLVVGGIGIMNIMLATVTERTREIGVRRALGAKRKDIVWQFLAETILLSGIGGISGILIGLACPLVIRQALRLMESVIPNVMKTLPDVIRHLEPQLVAWSIPLAFLISVSVGVLFGLYPAIRAAQMDPIEALRHE